MKQVKRTFLMLAIMLMAMTTAFAQQTNKQRPNGKQRISREQLAEKQAQHIARTLNFDDATTQKFTKTYCDYQKEIWALGPRKLPKKQNMTDQDNEERIKHQFAMSEKILNLRQKYYKEYSKYLTQTQIEKVYETEKKMMRRTANRMGKGRNAQKNKAGRPMKRQAPQNGGDK